MDNCGTEARLPVHPSACQPVLPKAALQMPTPMQQVEEILDKLAHDVESSVHAFYRGNVRQHTAKAKMGTFVAAAREALAPLLSGAPAPTASASVTSLEPDGIAAATRCVMAWLPMGAPSAANLQSRCIPAAREMSPTWGEREKARLA